MSTYTTGLKLLSESVSESKLKNSEKVHLLNSLKESENIEDVVNLLKEENNNIENIKRDLFRELNKDNLSESKKELREFLINEGVGKSVLGILIGPRLWLAWRTAKAILSKANRVCGAYNIGDKRDECLKKYKLKSYEEQIKVLEKVKKEADSPEQKKKVDKKISKLKNKVTKLKTKIAKKHSSDTN